MTKSWEIYTISTEHAGLTTEEYLRQVLLCSGRRLQKLTRAKGVRLNGKPVFLQKKLQAGDRLQMLALIEDVVNIVPEKGPVDILYEDAHLLILNKPPGLLVHPAGRTSGGTLANFLAYHWQQQNRSLPIRPVHRLDRDTSGCLLFAKSAASQTRLEEQLAAGLLKRTYQALVLGQPQPAAGIIAAAIGPHPRQANRRAISKSGEPAITHYRTLDTFSVHSLLELSLETGRTHQIRVHLAHLGHPVLGDGMYGHRSTLIPRQALHAVSVAFRCLSDATVVTVTAPWPDDFRQAHADCVRLASAPPTY